jgi:hypothetical protein
MSRLPPRAEDRLKSRLSIACETSEMSAIRSRRLLKNYLLSGNPKGHFKPRLILFGIVQY